MVNDEIVKRRICMSDSNCRKKYQYLLIRGVFSVGGRLSLIVIRNTVIDKRAEIPSVTFSPDSDGT